MSQKAMAPTVLPSFASTTSYSEIEQGFYDSARSVMLEHELVYQGQIMRITGLEVYLYSSAWPDPNSDRSPEQLNFGTGTSADAELTPIPRDLISRPVLKRRAFTVGC